MNIQELLESRAVIKYSLFGSRFVGCAEEDSDWDYLVLVEHMPGLVSTFSKGGFNPDLDDPLYGEYFSSWRKGSINLVFTDNPIFYSVTMKAANFCKKYKVFDKEDRIAVHEAFRDQVIPKDEGPLAPW